MALSKKKLGLVVASGQLDRSVPLSEGGIDPVPDGGGLKRAPELSEISHPYLDSKIATLIGQVIVPALLDRLLRQRSQAASAPNDDRVESRPAA